MTELIAGNVFNINQQSHDTADAWSVRDSVTVASPTVKVANTTLTREATLVRSAPAALKLTATNAGTVSISTGWKAVTGITPGASYILSTNVYAGATRSLRIVFNWVDEPGGNINVQQTHDAAGTQVANSWTEFKTAAMTVPANTTNAEVLYTFSNLAAGESIYLDDHFLGPDGPANNSYVRFGGVLVPTRNRARYSGALMS